jgi:hypothetical protein
VLGRLAWTPPMLVGTALYVRDQRSIMAFELSISISLGHSR